MEGGGSLGLVDGDIGRIVTEPGSDTLHQSPRAWSRPSLDWRGREPRLACCAGGWKREAIMLVCFVFVLCLIPGWHLSRFTVWPDLASREPSWHRDYPAPCDWLLAYFVLLSLLTAHYPPAWLHIVSLLAGGAVEGWWGVGGGGSTSCSGIQTDTRPWPISPNNLAHVKSTLKNNLLRPSVGVLAFWHFELGFFLFLFWCKKNSLTVRSAEGEAGEINWFTVRTCSIRSAICAAAAWTQWGVLHIKRWRGKG